MKNFRINLVVRVLLLSITVFLLLYFFYNTPLTATVAVFLVLIIYQVYSLIRKVESTNRELTRFLESVKHSDFSRTFPDSPMGESFRDLNNAFNEVITEFRKTRKEKEENFRYLQTVMQHVGVGLISYNAEGKVEFINNAAKRILRIPQLTNISALNKLSKGLGDLIQSLRSGDKKTIKILQDDLVQLIVYTAEFKLKGQNYFLTSIQNIQSEMEETEMEAWQKLIRVLTHEIMNSVTPISSLTSTVIEMIDSCRPESGQQGEEAFKDISAALNTIQKRSEGLLHFVDNYRSLTKIPKPNFQFFPVKMIFERAVQLFTPRLKECGVSLKYKVTPDSLEITADPELIEQVLINLILNSLQALNNVKGGEINLLAMPDERGKTIIKVIDNGQGIAEDLQDRIFVPFFTTRKEGSGIGLSLSRQIIRSHGGNIRVYSKPFEQTVFTIKI